MFVFRTPCPSWYSYPTTHWISGGTNREERRSWYWTRHLYWQLWLPPTLHQNLLQTSQSFFRRPIEVIVFLSDTIWNNIQLIFTIVGVMYLAISNTGCFSVAANILNRLTIFPIVAVVTVFLTSHRKSTFIIWMIASKFLYGLSSFWMTVFGGG